MVPTEAKARGWKDTARRGGPRMIRRDGRFLEERWRPKKLPTKSGHRMKSAVEKKQQRLEMVKQRGVVENEEVLKRGECRRASVAGSAAAQEVGPAIRYR